MRGPLNRGHLKVPMRQVPGGDVEGEGTMTEPSCSDCPKTDPDPY